MNISFSTLGCPRWSWGEIVSTAKDLGYKGIEIRGVGKDISVPSVPAFNDENIEATKAHLENMGIKIPCLDSDCLVFIPSLKDKVFEDVKAYIVLANKLSVPFVRIFAAPAVPEPSDDVDDVFVASFVKELAKLAREYKVTLLLETHGVWCESQRLARLLEKINSDSVGILWDIHHPYRFMQESPDKTYANIHPWLKHTHIKDSLIQDGKIRYVPCGKGDIPLPEMIKLLQKKSYTGFYSLEWVKRWDMSLEEPGIIFAHYINYMKQFDVEK